MMGVTMIYSMDTFALAALAGLPIVIAIAPAVPFEPQASAIQTRQTDAAKQPAPPAAIAPAPARVTPLWPGRHARFGGTEWLSRAKQDAPLGFTLAVEVQEVHAKGGMMVTKGDLLVHARDGEVLAALAAQESRSRNDTQVTSAQAQKDLAQAKFDGVEEAKAKNVMNKAEYDERKAQLAVAIIGIEAAQKVLEEEVLKTVQLSEQAKRYRIVAPFNGIVDQVVCEPGQICTDNQPVMRLVDISSLYIDVPIKTDETLRLKLKSGFPAYVLLDIPGPPVVRQGRVLYVAPAADAASGTRRVRVEVPNPDLLPPGTSASVRFTEPSADWNRDEVAAMPPERAQK